MSLRGFQQAMADLVASPAHSRAVEADARALDGYDLDARERRRLASVAAQRGMRLNQALFRANRAAPVFSLLPLTCFLLGDALSRELEGFWDSARGDARFAGEVLGFGEFLAGRVAEGALAIPALEDALAFETAALRLQLPSGEKGESAEAFPGIRVVRFGHDPLPLLQRLAERRPPPYDVTTGEFWMLMDARGGAWQVRSIDRRVGRLLDAAQNGRAPTLSRDDLDALEAALEVWGPEP